QAAGRLDAAGDGLGRRHGIAAPLHRLRQPLAERGIVVDDQQGPLDRRGAERRRGLGYRFLPRHVSPRYPVEGSDSSVALFQAIVTSAPPSWPLPKLSWAPVRPSRVWAMKTPRPMGSPVPIRPCSSPPDR